MATEEAAQGGGETESDRQARMRESDRTLPVERELDRFIVAAKDRAQKAMEAVADPAIETMECLRSQIDALDAIGDGVSLTDLRGHITALLTGMDLNKVTLFLDAQGVAKVQEMEGETATATAERRLSSTSDEVFRQFLRRKLDTLKDALMRALAKARKDLAEKAELLRQELRAELADLIGDRPEAERLLQKNNPSDPDEAARYEDPAVTKARLVGWVAQRIVAPTHMALGTEMTLTSNMPSQRELARQAAAKAAKETTAKASAPSANA